LVEERRVGWAARGAAEKPVYRLFPTAAGRRFYAAGWAAYRARYPTVSAPAPALPGAEGDHPGEGHH
jgi:hypothetical protein